MARRGQLRGQRRPAPTRGHRRAPPWQVERQRQRMAMAVGAVALVFILAIPIWGYITTFVLPPRQVVASVNGVPITMADLLKSVRIVQRGVEASGAPLDLGTLPFQTLNSLIEAEVIRQMAPQLGVTVGNEEVDQEIRSSVMGSSADAEEQDPAVVEAEFRERLREFLNLNQISEEDYRERVKARLLREKATVVVGREVAPIQPQVHLFQLSVADEETVKRVQKLAEEGTPFEKLVEEYEVNEENRAKGGEVGWVPKGLLGEMGDTIFDLEVGKLSEPGRDVSGQGDPQGSQSVTFVFFMVKEKAEAREVDEAQLKQLKQQALKDWITEVRKEQDIETTFGGGSGGGGQYEWLVKQLRSSSRQTPTPPSR